MAPLVMQREAPAAKLWGTKLVMYDSIPTNYCKHQMPHVCITWYASMEGQCQHIYAKYELPVTNDVARNAVHRQQWHGTMTTQPDGLCRVGRKAKLAKHCSVGIIVYCV